MTLEERCRAITLLLADVDGVLTDGQIALDNQGIESKAFHVRDGLGIKLWQKAGYQFGMVTLRSTQGLKVRAAELGIEILRQGVPDKLTVLKQVLAELKLTRDHVCYMGDDLPDLPAIRAAGLGVAVADACCEARQAANYTTRERGGCGAVREVIELILKAQCRWTDVIQTYL
ncbi:MAG: HAD-IIIA family hydrolase [Thermoguttaceae bacterium]|jgi:YrbI family 3-deoxy-D-manno-octulosonate 8-phosphate phosphatase